MSLPRSSKPLLLDLYCGAGGAATGYYRAGFQVIGVDIKSQLHYGYPFIEADALETLTNLLAGRSCTAYRYAGNGWQGEGWHFSQVIRLQDIAAIHASPPCQRYSTVTITFGNPEDWPDLIAPTRELLLATGLPYVIENVMSAPLDKSRSIVLCADNMGLRTVRHRRFEYSPGLTLTQPPHKPHRAKTATTHRKERWEQGWHVSLTGDGPGSHVGPEAMGIDWMTGNELCEAIPPAYTEYIGGQLMQYVRTQSLLTKAA